MSNGTHVVPPIAHDQSSEHCGERHEYIPKCQQVDDARRRHEDAYKHLAQPLVLPFCLAVKGNVLRHRARAVSSPVPSGKGMERYAVSRTTRNWAERPTFYSH
jgi:hypothetical protein